jgi:hypothetical protein
VSHVEEKLIYTKKICGAAKEALLERKKKTKRRDWKQIGNE